MERLHVRYLVMLLLIPLVASLGGCPMGGAPTDGDGDGDGDDAIATATANFETSLHNLRTGKETFYSAANGGFETLTNVPYSQLACQNCHASTLADGTEVDATTYEPSCADCHADPDNPTGTIAESVCLGCHGRQNAERGALTDVHRTAGMTCMDCHTAAEMHGDGNTYTSLLESPGPECDDCHSEGNTPGAPPSNNAHTTHMETVHCSACHVESVISCYNCHFETEVAGTGKRFFTPPRTGFKLLINFNDKVYPATFQSLVYEGNSFYAIAPYYAHSITSEVDCDDCHASTALDEYVTSGEITVTSFSDGTLTGPTGVIPVPPDWQTALLFDFLDWTGDPTTPIADTDPTLWEFLEATPDGTQMLFGEPLTAEQIDALDF